MDNQIQEIIPIHILKRRVGVPFPVSFTGALASVTVVGFTVLASNVAMLRIAAATVPPDPRLMLFGKLPHQANHHCRRPRVHVKFSLTKGTATS
ncbi:MAG: hypothetical protein HYV04_22190 [Deltaproteobacteria bacterium]|nr:hypothetical protein [Deltaproteobacteria bacterium]